MSSPSARPVFATALNAADLKGDESASQWIQLLPAGPSIEGRDGRKWRCADPQALVAAFNAQKGPLAVDYEHAVDLAPKGQATPASGWIEELEVRDGALWGRTDWTPKARNAIRDREYRFISPVFAHTATGDITAMIGAALVQRPNLQLQALNSQQQQDWTMDPIIATALGLPVTSTAEQAVTAINQLKADKQVALNAAATPDIAKFVPIATHQLALNRAQTAENQLAEIKKAGFEAEITSAVDAAVGAGKIAPSTKDFYLSTCRQEGGLEKFKAHVAELPTLFEVTKVEAKTADGSAALNAREDVVARAMGLSAKDFASGRD